MSASHKILNRKGVVVLILFISSTLLRLPLLLLYPVFRTDELAENIRALAIIRYGFIPLTNNAEFIGALYNYIIALVYLIKPSIAFSRLTIALFSSLTIPLLYILGLKIMRNPLKALLASIVLALSSAHILISSHVAWSASLAPFFLTLSLVYLLKSQIDDQKVRRNMFVFGLTSGFAIQAHPSTIASYIAFLTSWTIMYGKLLLIKIIKNTKYCLLGFCIGYLNMILFNIINPLGSIKAVFKASWTGLHGGLALHEFIRRMVFVFLEYVTMLVSGIPILPIQQLMKTPLFYIYSILFFVIVAYSVRKSYLAKFIVMYIILSLIIISIGTKGIMALNIFGFAWGPHYLQQLLPLTSILIAEALAIISHSLKKIGRIKRILVFVGLILIIVIWPFTNILFVYGFVRKEKCTNEIFIQTLNYLKTKYGKEIPIFVEYSLKSQGTLLFYELALLEGMNVYPPLMPFKHEISKYNMERFLLENKNITPLVLIVQPSGSCFKAIEELHARNIITINEYHTVKACFNVEVYKVIVIGEVHI